MAQRPWWYGFHWKESLCDNVGTGYYYVWNEACVQPSSSEARKAVIEKSIPLQTKDAVGDKQGTIKENTHRNTMSAMKKEVSTRGFVAEATNSGKNKSQITQEGRKAVGEVAASASKWCTQETLLTDPRICYHNCRNAGLGLADWEFIARPEWLKDRGGTVSIGQNRYIGTGYYYVGKETCV